ncbi:MAG: hypothetical protein ACJ75B_06765 [Flavisolibacter sp.]
MPAFDNTYPLEAIKIKLKMLDKFPEILKYGIIGLGAILAFLAYLLLTQEQKKSEPRSQILTATYVFMTFSLLLIHLGIFSDWSHSIQSPTKAVFANATGFPKGALNGSYNVSGSDIDLQSENFKTPRHHYTGEFQISEQDGQLIMQGEMQTLDAANKDSVLGTSTINSYLTINNNYVGGYYTNVNQRINGFGTVFLKFNNAATTASGYFIFRTTTGTAEIGNARFTLTRK